MLTLKITNLMHQLESINNNLFCLFTHINYLFIFFKFKIECQSHSINPFMSSYPMMTSTAMFNNQQQHNKHSLMETSNLLLTPPHTPGAISLENGSSSSSSVSAMSPPPLNLTKIKRNPEKQSQPEPMKKRKFDFANLARSATEPDDDIDVIHSTSNQQICDKFMDENGAKNTNSNGGRRKKKKFICRFCQRQFTKSYNLLIHERTHTDERPFNCDICGKAFRRQDHLRDHR